jgi:uncharacterized membrane protein
MSVFQPIREIDVYGVFMPPLLLWGFVSLIAVKVIHRALSRRKFYRSNIEQQLFDTSLFIILLGVFSFVT